MLYKPILFYLTVIKPYYLDNLNNFFLKKYNPKQNKLSKEI